MLGVQGQYLLKVRFGDVDIPLTPTLINEFTIVHDLRKFSPEFRLRLEDTSGEYTHLKPFDKSMSKVSFQLALPDKTSKTQNYKFDIYRRSPIASGVVNGEYDIRGLLEVNNAYSPSPSRSFNDSVYNIIITLAKEMGIKKYNISQSLKLKKIILQPNWTNTQVLSHIAENIVGLNGVTNYRCYLTVNGNDIVLNFLSLSEMIKAPIKRKYIFADRGIDDQIPAYNYEIIDNYKYSGTMGNKKQTYTYFNYETGAWVTADKNVEDLPSLTQYFAVDKEDESTGLNVISIGRNNTFNGDYSGTIKSCFETRIQDLSKMWITTQGDLEIMPGELVQVIFPQNASNMFSYQYSGYWLVERVVYNIDDVFKMQLLLTRNGFDSDKSTSLIKAENRKR